MQSLLDTLPQTGSVVWIGLRPGRREPMRVVDRVEASTKEGLIGDRYSGRSGKRQVTLIQAEHLTVIARCLGRAGVAPELLRRNLVIERINLLALKNRHVTVGSAILEITGLCHPCSFMEQTLGAGGYNAVRGHGGLTARVVADGTIGMGDAVSLNIV
ncbi:MAG: MOSC domain-containing protein [Gammaproteobacteria bacterium]